MTSDPVVAIDLGRYKSVACGYHRATRSHAFRTPGTTPEDLTRLLARHPGALVVVEACAHAGRARDHAAAGHGVKVADTAAEPWKFTHLKRKTDRDGARRLAELGAIGRLPTACLPGAATRQRRMLIAFRSELVGRRAACQNRIRALFAGAGRPAPRGHRAWAAVGLAGIEAQARPPAGCGPGQLWRGMLYLAAAEYRPPEERVTRAEAALDRVAEADPRTARPGTTPGVGRRTAEAVSADPGDPHRSASAERVGAYPGLAPKQYQSGATDREGRITRRGPGVLRERLVECAWCRRRDNPWARAVYARLTAGGATRKKPAVVALAGRLSVRCWAMLRGGEDWRVAPVPAAAAG